MDISRVTVGFDFKEHDDAITNLILEIEKLQLWISQGSGDSRVKKQVDHVHDLALVMKRTYPVVVACVERLRNDIEVNEKILAQKSHQIEKLVVSVTRLQDEIAEMMKENNQNKTELARIRRSALRRQIALNIEYEVKLEMLNALGQDTSEEIVLEAKMQKLRRKVMSASLPVPELTRWLNFVDDDVWSKFTGTMNYLKAFSQEAHPTTLDGAPVGISDAMKLIEDDFDISAVRTQKYSWGEDLRAIAKSCVETLAKSYRRPGDPLLFG